MPRRANIPPGTIDKIVAAHADGMTARRIATEVGVSDHLVRRVLRDNDSYVPGPGWDRRVTKVSYVPDPEPEEHRGCRWPGCHQARERGHACCYHHKKIALGFVVD